MSIDQAMRQLADGGGGAFEYVYAQTRKTVYYIALSIVRERMLAEDVMQNTYLKVLANASRFRGGNAAAWIAKIAKHEAISALRKYKREVSVDHNENVAVFGVSQADRYGELIDLARRVLKEKEFAVLLLSAAEGYKRREIAEILGLPVPTVTWHYTRALKKMQDALEQVEILQGGGGNVDKKQLERELRFEAEQYTPDVYAKVCAAAVDNPAATRAAVIAKSNRVFISIMCALAALAIILACILPFMFKGGGFATIYISINPAVEFNVHDGKVTGTVALNRDAALLIVGEDYSGLTPEEASEKFVKLSENKHLVTTQGVGLRVTGDDSENIERRVRERIEGLSPDYGVYDILQTDLDALIAAYDEQAMGDFEDYLERELSTLKDGFAERVHVLMETYLSDLNLVPDAMSVEEFNLKYLYLGEDCIFEDDEFDKRDMREEFEELSREISRHGDEYIFDELYDEFLEAVEEQYEPDDDEDDDDDDDDDDDERDYDRRRKR